MVIQRLGMRPMKDARPIMRRDRPRIELITRRSLQLQMICGRGPVTHSCSGSQCLHASIISMLTSRYVSLFALFESACACMCVDVTASMFASNQTACQRKKTSDDENLCSSPVKPTTTPHTRLARALRSSLKIRSASFARRFVLDGHGEAGICSNNGKL